MSMLKILVVEISSEKEMLRKKDNGLVTLLMSMLKILVVEISSEKEMLRKKDNGLVTLLMSMLKILGVEISSEKEMLRNKRQWTSDTANVNAQNIGGGNFIGKRDAKEKKTMV